jgi:Ribbon-helix-helix protein, copG family
MKLWKHVRAHWCQPLYAFCEWYVFGRDSNWEEDPVPMNIEVPQRQTLGAQVTIRLDAKMVERLREEAAAKGVNYTALIRAIIAAALTDENDLPDAEIKRMWDQGTPVTLTDWRGSFRCEHMQASGLRAFACGICGPMRRVLT